MITKRRVWGCRTDAVELGMVFLWIFTYQSKA
jgi:hypothetical protein